MTRLTRPTAPGVQKPLRGSGAPEPSAAGTPAGGATKAAPTSQDVDRREDSLTAQAQKLLGTELPKPSTTAPARGMSALSLLLAERTTTKAPADAAHAAHDDAHAHGDHSSHTLTNLKDGRSLDVRADGHTTGTHLGDTGHMPLSETVLKRGAERTLHGHAEHAESHHDGGHGEAHHGPDVGANATLAAVHTQSKWRSALGDRGAAGHDPTFLDDKTGAAAEAHVLAARTGAGAAAGVDLKHLQVIAGADASAHADLVGASARAQLGSGNTRAGQAMVQGEAHVGARAAVGGGLTLDPRHGSAKVSVGGEAFAGAEVKARVGYQSRYGGVELEARAQAGAGAAAQAQLGFDDGVLKARADLGACVGLGGRIAVNVSVNVGALAQDASAAVKSLLDDSSP